MLKFLYDLGDGDDMESNLVAEASNRLDVGEFQVFQLGFANWHGRDADPQMLEKVFFDYLYQNQVPSWARDFSRKIIALDEKGKLDANEAQYHRYDPAGLRPLSLASGATKMAVFFICVVAFLGIAIFLLYDSVPDDQPCQFPPCSWNEEAGRDAPRVTPPVEPGR